MLRNPHAKYTMLRSMTGYGRFAKITPFGYLAVEIQSVNRKFLEFSFALPPELRRFESEIRKWLSPHLLRGAVTVKVVATFDQLAPMLLTPNIPLAQQLKTGAEILASTFNLVADDVFSNLLMHHRELFSAQENPEIYDAYLPILREYVANALQPFLHARLAEGAALQKDLVDRLEEIEKLVNHIEHLLPETVKKYQEKLVHKIEELLPGRVENEERILREIALFADKVDLAEELVRFRYHMQNFLEKLRSGESGVGKTLEFLLQELNREINTIGNKSLHLEVSTAVIAVKGELERIREQVQNIE